MEASEATKLLGTKYCTKSLSGMEGRFDRTERGRLEVSTMTGKRRSSRCSRRVQKGKPTAATNIKVAISQRTFEYEAKTHLFSLESRSRYNNDKRGQVVAKSNRINFGTHNAS